MKLVKIYYKGLFPTGKISSSGPEYAYIWSDIIWDDEIEKWKEKINIKRNNDKLSLSVPLEIVGFEDYNLDYTV